MNISHIHNAENVHSVEAMHEGVTYGYIKVSIALQHGDRQRMVMESFGISEDRLFADKQSGKDFDRPAYNMMMDHLTRGDTVVVKSLDGLGGDYEEMIHQLDIITREKNATIVILVILDMPLIDTRRKESDDLTGKFISNLVIQSSSPSCPHGVENESSTYDGEHCGSQGEGVSFQQIFSLSQRILKTSVPNERQETYRSTKLHDFWMYLVRFFINGYTNRR